MARPSQWSDPEGTSIGETELQKFRERVAALTSDDRRVFMKIVHGKTNLQISADLNLSLKGVKVSRDRLLEQFEMGGNVELIRYARAAGLVSALKE